MPAHALIAAALLGCLLVSASAGQAQNAFCVSPSGSDANPGTRRKPFARPAKARDAIRAARKAGKLGHRPVTVTLRAGTYPLRETLELTAEDSGTEAAPVLWQAALGEQVRLIGGVPLAREAFAPVTDEAVLSRLDPAARGRVLVADPKAAGVADLGQFPVHFQGAPPVPELFCNDQRMTLARWPSEGWATIAKIIDSGSRPRDGDNSNRPGVFEYSGDRPARWNVTAGVWLHGYWCYDWYDETIQVKSIDPATHRISLAAPALYSVLQGNPSPRRYAALNVLEELDSPGEYYLDRAAGRLYFWPPADAASMHCVLSTLTTPVLALRDASHVTVRGFVVEAALGNGIEVTGGAQDRIEACEVRNTRELGIRVAGGVGHRVEACDIHHTGTGGLVLSGGDRKTLTPAGHEALNDHIYRYSELKLTYANAIILEGVGNRAAHNLIHGAPHQAIGVHGNDHIFEYNVVHHVCLETDDCGAYYKGRNPSCRGNIVRYNLWHHIGSPMGHGNAAVYFDDGDGGDTVFGNVFFRCGEPGRGPFGTVFSHGGHGITAENNVFVECKRAFGSAPWDFARWKDAINGGQDCGWQTLLLKDVDITRPPYTTRYPELVGFMNPQPDQPRISHARRNLLVRCADVSNGNWQCDPADTWVTDTDPGFVDAATGNFALRPDSEAFTRLPGFEPIPFEKIGLYADKLRPYPPQETWAADGT